MFKSTIAKTLAYLGYELRRKSRSRLDMTWKETSKVLYFQRMYDHIRDIEGDIVECGVGWGYGLLKHAFLIKNEGKDRLLWGFDSFEEGFPQPTEHDRRLEAKALGMPPLPEKGAWKTDIDNPMKLFLACGLEPHFYDAQVKLVKGFFEDSLPKYEGRIALLSADADLYGPYITILQELYPKVVPGGVILFDEYEHEAWKLPGPQKAIDEYFGEEKDRIKIDRVTGHAYFIKDA